MSNSIDVDRALMGYLAADAALAALVPDGIWYDVAPMGARYYVIVSQMDHSDSYVLNGYLWERILYLVKCVRQDHSPDTAAAAAQRVYELLQDFVHVVIPTYQIALARRVERARAVEIDENSDLRWQHVGGNYEILAAPLVPVRQRQVLARGAS